MALLILASIRHRQQTSYTVRWGKSLSESEKRKKNRSFDMYNHHQMKWHSLSKEATAFPASWSQEEK
jgi:hypothetical protein